MSLFVFIFILPVCENTTPPPPIRLLRLLELSQIGLFGKPLPILAVNLLREETHKRQTGRLTDKWWRLEHSDKPFVPAATYSRASYHKLFVPRARDEIAMPYLGDYHDCDVY